MFISNIHLSEADNNTQSSTIHNFYRDSFSALYGIKNEEICNFNDLNIEWILNSLKNTLINQQEEAESPEYFFDIRTTEDYSSPAPEYLILHKLGLKNTNPLSVKGMGTISFIMALKIADTYLKNDEKALFCLMEQYNRYDINKADGYCASFLASRMKGDYKIVEYDIYSSEDQIRRLIKEKRFDDIIVEDGNDESTIKIEYDVPFLTGIFGMLKAQLDNCNKRLLFIYKSHGMWGYIIFSKGE